MKNSNDTIGNRTRDLPVCSTVPQLTACPISASSWFYYKEICYDAARSHERHIGSDYVHCNSGDDELVTWWLFVIVVLVECSRVEPTRNSCTLGL
jgi:hypothetical protein